MKSRWLSIGLSVVLVLVVAAFAYIVSGLNNKYDGWIEDQINGALGTSLTYSETTGKYVASTSRPDSGGFTYTDAIIEVEPGAFAELLDDAEFPSAWEALDGNNPPLPAGGADTGPWWRDGDLVLGNQGWGGITRVYQRVVESEAGTFVFLLAPDSRLLRWRLYVRSAAELTAAGRPKASAFSVRSGIAYSVARPTRQPSTLGD